MLMATIRLWAGSGMTFDLYCGLYLIPIKLYLLLHALISAYKIRLKKAGKLESYGCS